MANRYVFDFEETAAGIESAYQGIMAIRRSFNKSNPKPTPTPIPVPTPTPTPTPVPVPPASQFPKLVYKVTDWTKQLYTDWSSTPSPERTQDSHTSDFAFVDALDSEKLQFTLKNVEKTPEHKAGMRILLDKAQSRSWGQIKDWYDHTVEFLDSWYLAQEIPVYYGDGGDDFLSWGYQFKNSAAAGAPAGLAMNVHTFRGVGMRYWLQANTWANHAQDDNSPLIPVGVEYQTRLLVHFHSDPTKGWMQLEYAGHTLKAMGAAMSADKGCGIYKCFYGKFSSSPVNITGQTRKTIINLLD